MLVCRSVGSGGVFSSDVQAQLRFAPIDKETHNIKDMYPPCLVLRLNGKIIQLPVGDNCVAMVDKLKGNQPRLFPPRK